jgi:hypothetical protein
MRIRFGPVQLPSHFHTGRTLEMDDESAAALYELVGLKLPTPPKQNLSRPLKPRGRERPQRGSGIARAHQGARRKRTVRRP